MSESKRASDQTVKDPKLVSLAQSLLPANSPGLHASIMTEKCVWCLAPATEFADDLSKREYRISGLCQKCQDDVFGPAAEAAYDKETPV